MNWLLHNVIADMYGPYFLLFYAMSIVVLVVACYQSVRSLDRTRNLEPPKIPTKLDPYEIAYLRGGENEVARVAIASLIQRGLLQDTERRDWSSTALAIIREIDRGREPAPGEVSPIEACILKWSEFPTTRQQIYQPDGIPALLEEPCARYQDHLAEETLLVPPEMKRIGVWLWWIGSALILGLGGYKLAVALAKGHPNVVFLVALAIVGVIALAPACLAFPRTSRRGRAYLEQLELAYSRLKGQVRVIGSPPPSPKMAGDPEVRSRLRESSVYSDRLLMAGIFGEVALADTPISAMLRPGTSSTGSCGGGCGGGGGGGGGGCGGGCGGCGG
jgi:uncharacterized protein (TIGR04222 family)